MICSTCGVQRANAPVPHVCPICADERQYVPKSGQAWTTPGEVAADRKIVVEERRAGLFELRAEPEFGIGQRMFFVVTEKGNFTWDLVPFVDEPILEFFETHGGVDGMAISHPHFYSTMRDWHEATNAPIYTHAEDAAWLGERFEGQELWIELRRQLSEQVQLIHCGGHFEGSAIMHVAPEVGEPFILTGDTIYPVADGKHVSFMRSFPNNVPLGPKRLRGIDDALKGISFEQIYGAFPGHEILKDGRAAYEKSMARYLNYIHDVA